MTSADLRNLENTAKAEGLSDIARCVLGAMFGYGQVLTYHMIESIPSPEMQTALDELVSANMLVKEQGLPDMTRRAVRYRAAEHFNILPYKQEHWQKLADGDAPIVRVFIKREHPLDL